MKRLVVLFLVAMATMASVQCFAQKIESKSSTLFREEKVTMPKIHWWTVKLGGGVTSPSIDETTEHGGAYNVSVSYNQFIPDYSGLYWGAQLGTSMVRELWEVHEVEGADHPTIYFGPKIGYMRSVATNVDFDAHLSANYEYGFGNYNSDGGMPSNFTPEIGVGIWYKNIGFGVQYSYIVTECKQNRVLFNFAFRF